MPSSSSSTEENLNVFCKQIQQLDNSIRFVSIANNLGSLITTAYRNGLTPLMNEQETLHYGIQAVLRAATREDFESKIGRLEYSIGKYERLIRATIPIRLFGNDDDDDYDQSKSFYLLISFDLKSNVIDVIENKVMPYIENNKEYQEMPQYIELLSPRNILLYYVKRRSNSLEDYKSKKILGAFISLLKYVN